MLLLMCNSSDIRSLSSDYFLYCEVAKGDCLQALHWA
jgi:hypothetical protein